MQSQISRSDVVSRYTFGEELANSVIHGIATALSVAGLCVLVALAAMKGDPWKIVSFSIFGATLVILYLTSTLYHSFRAPEVKRKLRILDHAAIYLLIAGSYTPFTLVCLRGGWGWSLFGIIWGLAIAGVCFKLFLFGRFKIVSLALYLAMGWFVIIAIKPVMAGVPSGGVLWLFFGGCAYTFGVVFYIWKKLPYHHAVWHLFVTAGSACHFLSMLLYILPG